jgi:hypothetical protein
MLCVDGKPALALEVVKTHFSSVDKVESTRADGIELAEFLVEDVMSLRSKGGGHLDNLQVKMIRCQACLVKARERWMLSCWEAELRSWVMWESIVDRQYQDNWEEAKERQRKEQSALQFRQSLTGITLTDAKLILKHYWQSIAIRHPRFGQITFTRPFGEKNENQNGLYVDHWECYTTLPTRFLFIRLLGADGISSVNWHVNGLEDDFVIFLYCSKVISDLHAIEELDQGDTWEFNDCKWPILKDLERSNGICASCSKRGHTSETCFRKFCIRCGRLGHIKKDCYAKRDTHGQTL